MSDTSLVVSSSLDALPAPPTTVVERARLSEALERLTTASGRVRRMEPVMETGAGVFVLLALALTVTGLAAIGSLSWFVPAMVATSMAVLAGGLTAGDHWYKRQLATLLPGGRVYVELVTDEQQLLVRAVLVEETETIGDEMRERRVLTVVAQEAFGPDERMEAEAALERFAEAIMDHNAQLSAEAEHSASNASSLDADRKRLSEMARSYNGVAVR